MKLNVFMFLILTTLGFSPSAVAAWSSGGGELIQDAGNPWFVQNTKIVTYCVTADEANFGLATATAKQRIVEAIAFWQDEIPGAKGPVKWIPDEKGTTTPLERGSYGVGSQRFVFGECQADTDLRFQLGNLSPEQRQKMGDVSRIVSMAIRTDYDATQLRGKGFIYVSPEQGGLSLSGGDVISARWSYRDGQRLRLVLEHELGHVFGVPHHENNILMSEHFPENLVNKNWSALFDSYRPHIFAFASASTVICDRHNRIDTKKVFNFPADWACQRLDLSKTGFTLYGRKVKDQGEWVRLGSANASVVKVHRVATVCTYLPREQQVFDVRNPDPKAWPAKYLCGPYIYHERITGTYVSSDGKITRSYFADLKPTGYEVSGISDAELDFDVLSGRD